MSKYVVFTFDDGRADQYSNAVKIMKKYGLVGTIYITTGFVDGTLEKDRPLFLSSGGLAMTRQAITDCLKCGIEIGSHSDRHTNQTDDIKKSVEKLTKWGVKSPGEKIGFASPSSDIWAGNIKDIRPIKEIKYVRTGRQIRRNGTIYTSLFMLNQILKSKRLFWHLNKRYVNHPQKKPFLIESVAVRCDTPERHIEYGAKQLQDGECLVLLFHSILSKNDPGYDKDCWYYDIQKFEKVCRYFSGREYQIVTMTEAVDKLLQR